MPEDLANRRFTRLQNQYRRLESEIDELDTHVPLSNPASLIGDAESVLAKTSRLQTQVTKTESDTEDFRSLYDRYVATMDKLERRLVELHSRIGFLEMHASQKTGNTTGELTEINDVCAEILPIFDLDIEILPVIWESYATTYLDDPDNGDFPKTYLVQIPRQHNPEFYHPLIAHEVAHPLFKRNDIPIEFREKIREIDADWGGETGEFANKWRDWYMEFFCDACGVLSFGPAFVFSMADYLHHQMPYKFSVSRYDAHPPRALRLESMMQFAERVCSERFWARMQPFVRRVERHLDLQEPTKRERYDTYVTYDLESDIHSHVVDLVANELDRVEAELQSYTGKQDVDTGLRYRTSSNRVWFEWLEDMD